MPTSTGGTTLQFNSATLGIVQSIRDNETGAELDITDISSNGYRIFECGIRQKEISVTVKGAGTAAVGETGAIALTWNDGGSSIPLATTYVCLGNNKSGEVGGQSMHEYTFKPAS